jgi:Tol biopolymer transport system component
VPHTGPGLDPHTDVFVRDRRRGVTRRASSDRRGRMANAGSCFPSVADNGDVAFVSEATDLVRGDRNRFTETFVWDWSSRRVRAVAKPPSGGPGTGSEGAAISPDGRYVAFYTGGRLAASDTDALGDAYLYDRRRGSVAVVSPGALDCFHAGVLELTPQARHVLHWCGDMVRVLDRGSGRVVNATPTLDGVPPNSTVTNAGISADGRTVVFCTSANNFPRPSGGVGEWVYAWQRDSEAVTALANAGTCVRTADVSADGRTALFTADMPGLVPNDVGDARQSDAFVTPLR